MDIPETQQAQALQRVAEVAERRAQAIAALDQELEEVAVGAVRVGAGRNRVRELARVSPKTLYGWLTEAGVEVRAKAPAARSSRKAAPDP